ncbi:hypothetical protein VNI00_005016 [Paramarasmius palmivorus]|uniref:alkaline phosphatase n=1 Tax=Paramarasmius palmivorus TaxID=297713 RepID=A0AAW0DIP4_9AGAR
MKCTCAAFLVTASLVGSASAQYYKRLGACPKLGCVFPPDQTEFLPGQYFDVRLEVHAPQNGTEAFADGKPDESFSFCIQKEGEECVDAAQHFDVSEPELEKWTFSYWEDLFARDEKKPTIVNVASKAYRALTLNEPGNYTAKLSYYGGSETVAHWTVREPAKDRVAKNVILFIGDGMTQSMITAARLIAHKSINGKYQTLMQMDQMEALGHQMTHSIDSFITDSANSATALYTGKKSTVNALNVWVDSSSNSFDDPKVESIAELFRRRTGGPIGMVSTAFIADATPAALCSHTRDRNQYAQIVFEYLNGAEALNSTFAWPTGCEGPDVVFGGGAEHFIAGPKSFNGTDFYEAFQDQGYNVVYNKTDLESVGNDQKTLGIFTKNLLNQKNSPTGDGTDAVDQPGLKEMTLKAIDILQARSNGSGWFMMSEAASIDKMMHVLDYDRALGELLELDDTIRATIAHLEEIGELENTLIVVTADHGHGFDVFGGADTKYLAAQTSDRKKRDAVGVYVNSGLSGYTVEESILPTNDTLVIGAQGPNFPVTWNPRYVYAAGFAANPDHREGYAINTTGPRLPATEGSDGSFEVNPADQPDGFVVNGTLPTSADQGVHSLTDVSVFANGPGHEKFRGVYNSIDIFFKIADALALGETSEDC